MHTRRDEALTLNKTVNIGMLRDITNLIKEAFPEVPLIPTVGNHDFFRDSQTSTAMLESMSKVFFNETELHTATFKKGNQSFKMRSDSAISRFNSVLICFDNYFSTCYIFPPLVSNEDQVINFFNIPGQFSVYFLLLMYEFPH